MNDSDKAAIGEQRQSPAPEHGDMTRRHRMSNWEYVTAPDGLIIYSGQIAVYVRVGARGDTVTIEVNLETERTRGELARMLICQRRGGEITVEAV